MQRTATDVASPRVGSSRPRTALGRIASALAHDGPAGAARVLRHGLKWRYRRLLRIYPALGRRVLARRGVLGGTPVTATASVAVAETTLSALRVATSARAPLPKYPTVGVVIPSYRDAGFLGDALQSVVDQTYPHWRCVVVDDASPEDVGAVVVPFSSDDARIELLRHGANAGLSAARNTGLRQLDTDMVMFLDADDLLVPRAMEDAVECFSALWDFEAVAGVHGQVIQVPEETELAEVQSWRANVTRPRVDWTGYQGECPFNVHAVVLRRDLIDRSGGFDEALRDGAEDWDLWLRLLRHGYRFEPNDNLMGAYRQHPASMVRRHQGVHLGRAAALFDAAELWADLDPTLIVGRGGAAPLSRARLAHERAKRAAAVIGMQITSTGCLDPLTDSEAYELLDLAALSEGRRTQLVKAAVNGAARGLGISRAIMPQLSPSARDRLGRVGVAVAEAILEHPFDPSGGERTYDATSRRRNVDVLLAAESIADVVALAPVAERTEGALCVAAVDLEVLCGDSGATAAWREAGVGVILPYHQAVSAVAELSHLVACSPTGPVTADLLRAARLAGVKCHVVRVAGRPEPLECSTAVVKQAAESATDVARELESGLPRMGDISPRPLRGWRGSAFPSRLHREDGPADSDSIERLAALHNRHLGETAVIVGNGPSLNDTELDVLTDVPTFGVNAIFLAADRFPKPITYYVVEDTMVFRDNVEAIKAFTPDWKLFPAMYRPRFDDSELDEHTVFFRMNAGFYGRETGTACHPRFSLDATQRVYCGQSVTIVNLQLAHWMGFRRVVLIGMDFSYRIPDDADRKGGRIISRSDDPNHFHPDYFGAGKTWNDPKLDRVLVSYHLADEIYRATGREIINATEGGKLDLFPRMSLREAIGVGG